MDVVRLHTYLFEPIQQRPAVVEQRMDDDAGAEGKGDEVGDGVGGWEVEGRVGEVGGL